MGAVQADADLASREPVSSVNFLATGMNFRIRSAALLFLFPVMLVPSEVTAQEQYLVINIAPEEETAIAVGQIRQTMKRSPSDHVRLGVGAIFSYLDTSRERCTEELLEFLSLAERYDIPVVVQLDGEQWWKARPDLWNWWDPGLPGYDPENRLNVEWSGWGPEHAMKIAWRNWGEQIRVLPPPNFMSPRYRKACHEEMRIHIPLILRWWANLPDEKKYLLIGVKLGWETAIGVNSFYYPNGNALLDAPEIDDPRTELKGDDIPGRGVKAIGYAAVSTARLAHRGVLQEEHLAEIVRRHLADLCALAAGLGVPREKLFTHVGGWKEEELLYEGALNDYSCPGWSFYRHAKDPAKDAGVQKALRKSNAPFWAAAEWLLMGKNDKQAWLNALGRTLSDPACRYVCIYNWSGIKDDRAALDAIQDMLDAREVHP